MSSRRKFKKLPLKEGYEEEKEKEEEHGEGEKRGTEEREPDDVEEVEVPSTTHPSDVDSNSKDRAGHGEKTATSEEQNEDDQKPAATDDPTAAPTERIIYVSAAPTAEVVPQPDNNTDHTEWMNSYAIFQHNRESPDIEDWIKEQRRQYALFLLDDVNSQMTPERIEMLEKLDFQWNPKKRTAAVAIEAPAAASSTMEEDSKSLSVRLGTNTKHHDDSWNQRYQELVTYYQEKGDCLVPKGYKANTSLANWVKTQRRNFKLWHENETACCLTPERIQLLEEINFSWKVRGTPVHIYEGWMGRHQQLAQYQKTHGDCNHPKDPILSQWVELQKLEYQRYIHKKPSCLTAERVELLNELQFRWEEADDWNIFYQQLQVYHGQHGNCLVPKHYVDNPGLSAWVRSQRREYKLLREKRGPSNLTPERMEQLHRLRFEFHVEEDFSSWDENYEQLKARFDKTGDCSVSRKENETLSNWVKTQRKDYKRFQLGERKGCSMTPERIQLLEQIKFQWTIRTRDEWMVRFVQLKHYGDKHGDVNVPKSFKENPTLGNWVATQRKEYKHMQEGKKSYLTQDRIELLSDIGFQWSVYQQGGWMLRYRELEAYKSEHGDTNVPKAYAKNASLGNWVRTQRREYKKYKDGDTKGSSMTSERVQMLESIGFQWQRRLDESQQVLI